MKQWKGTKCEPGYIEKQKRFQAVMLLVFAAIGIGLFLIGYLATGTRVNVFTVLAILMVLPGAKRVIALVVMVPRRSVEQGRYDRMKEAISPDAVLLTDYVFTSSEKIMNLDFVIVEGRVVTGIRSVNERRRDAGIGKYMKDYLSKGIAGVADGYRVNILDSDEAFYRQYERAGRSVDTDVLDDAQAEVVKFLKILAV